MGENTGTSFHACMNSMLDVQFKISLKYGWKHGITNHYNMGKSWSDWFVISPYRMIIIKHKLKMQI